MAGKKLLLLVLISLFLVIGCGGGGDSSSGGSSPTNDTIVGTWNRVSFTGTGANSPQQIIFNSNGTGSYSGTASGSGSLAWSQVGTQLTITAGGVTNVFTLPAPGTVFNSFTLLYTGGGTAVYNRA